MTGGPVVIDARGGNRGQFEERQRRIAGALRAGGIARGDRIAFVSRNRSEPLELAMAALKLGVVPVPVNPLLTEHERAYVLQDSGARWLFLEEGLPDLEGIMATRFGPPFESLIAKAHGEDLPPCVLGRPMHYTSGTTGVPKGVYVKPSEENAAAISERFRDLWGIHAGDVHLVCSPLAHSAPLRFAIRTLEAGGRVVLQERFDPHATIAAIERHRVTTTFMVPTHLERLLRAEDALRVADLSTVRLLAHAGAPIRETTKRRVIGAFPPGSVWEFYGSTEGQATRISTPEWLARPGSVGSALPGAEILVADERFTPVPEGEVGHVWVRDPNAERFSYWGDEAKTAAAWRNGAFTVGDLGRLDGDGYLYLTGRAHDTIITGGVNVYPQEVEAVLGSHPDVAEAMVFGVEDEEWGQRVCARIIPRPGTEPEGQNVIEWLRGELAPYKVPRTIELVDELPRTATGKPKRPRS